MIRGLFHEPPGVDFSRAVVAGLRARLSGHPPEAMARVTLLVNTNRMADRLRAAFAQGGPTLLPRIGLVSQPAALLPPGAVAPADLSPLALRLRLTQLVRHLLTAQPDVSPPSAAFDLAGTLLTLLEEIQEEGMDPQALETLDVRHLSEHWNRSLAFLRIVADWSARGAGRTPMAAQTDALTALLAQWSEAPPTDPVVIAGSTASRAPTRRLIDGVLALPQGAVILPGLDGDMPDAAWDSLVDPDGQGAQDHPQFRHAALLAAQSQTRADCPSWSGLRPAAPTRNRLVSLALRPAPATDAWREEGPDLSDLSDACEGVTLLAAPTPGAEAMAIALGLRAALADGKRAALITPDRTLSRQVAAQLDRWGIEPDDSAGRPLQQSAPGRLLLTSAALLGRRPEAEALTLLLSHPLTRADDRIDHLRHARALEVELLREGPCPFPDRAAVAQWVADPDTSGQADAWTDWLCDLLDRLGAAPAMAPLASHLDTHLAVIEHLSGDAIWQGEAGRSARAVVEGLRAAAPEGGDGAIGALEYTRILQALLSAEEVRETYAPHPDVMIWGALEARARTADLVILGGLTDGVWPDQPAADPWLNRAMRAACGLRLPERSTGLSAHDFQQAVAGPEVWLSRATRDAEADLVPSRWVNRIEGLLGGLGGQAAEALSQMRARGDRWLRLAGTTDQPDTLLPPAPRPGPVVPASAQPKRLSVTAIEMLIRDPYAIYARHVLGLRALGPLRQTPDARLRGTVVHTAMERFAGSKTDALDPGASARLRNILEATLEQEAPWPATRRLWLGKFDRILDDLLTAEATRRSLGRPILLEERGRWQVPGLDFALTAEADRMDDRGVAVAIYDYKTGKPPTPKQQALFAKQLLLEAIMVEEGAFGTIGKRAVDEVAYLQVGSTYAEQRVQIDADVLAATRAGLRDLIEGYRAGRPFVARLMPEALTYASDFDQLSRRGEWDDTQRATTIRVGQ
ncbi:double-strand break repair protein AddB [Jannaschia pagri]|uniref:Double-strand break repair protein AddB n=1 Tax=Jannaschia pagri TaxID=2829797 RepID=A0ABQ4NQ98_9RHOB|nr:MULTISPECIES: double-strand break repair protein AddB [unclassified Jannaschia]GIT92557.1 double-strand break repair protein AddB [Jannaschia sp. AI_61]GIT96583.1 double-strand break repair protein AddB [Jannaschia sp. AI_62]